MMLVSERNLLRERVNTFLGSLLIGVVALWAGMTIWQTANGTNPIAKAFINAYERTNIENY